MANKKQNELGRFASSQVLDNSSFDEELGVYMYEMVGSPDAPGTPGRALYPMKVASDGSAFLGTTPATADALTFGTLTIGSVSNNISMGQFDGLSVAIRTSATLGGVLVFEVSNDGTNFTPVAVKNVATGTVAFNTGTTFAASTMYIFEVPTYGFMFVRARITTAIGAALTAAIAMRHLGEIPVDIVATIANATLAVTQSGVWTTVAQASVSGVGQSTVRLPAASTTPLTVKTTAARLYSYFIQNPSVEAVWVHFYNAVVGSVTVGTTVPLWSVWIPAGGAVDMEADTPKSFGTALSVAVTTTLSGTTAPTTPSIAFIGYA